MSYTRVNRNQVRDHIKGLSNWSSLRRRGIQNHEETAVTEREMINDRKQKIAKGLR